MMEHYSLSHHDLYQHQDYQDYYNTNARHVDGNDYGISFRYRLPICPPKKDVCLSDMKPSNM